MNYRFDCIWVSILGKFKAIKLFIKKKNYLINNEGLKKILV